MALTEPVMTLTVLVMTSTEIVMTLTEPVTSTTELVMSPTELVMYLTELVMKMAGHKVYIYPPFSIRRTLYYLTVENSVINRPSSSTKCLRYFTFWCQNRVFSKSSSGKRRVNSEKL